MLNKNFTCCFTGHRKILPKHAEKLPGLIESAVRRLMKGGYNTFVTGGALGFDTIAAEVILKIKRTNPYVKLIVVAPYLGQPLEWDYSSQITYERIREAADDYISLAAGYYRDCMKKRNLYMVEMSSACISYCLRDRTGTSQTVAFARDNGLEVIELSEKLK